MFPRDDNNQHPPSSFRLEKHLEGIIKCDKMFHYLFRDVICVARDIIERKRKAQLNEASCKLISLDVALLEGIP